MKHVILAGSGLISLAMALIAAYVAVLMGNVNDMVIFLDMCVVFCMGFLLGIPHYICKVKYGVSSLRFALTTLLPVLAAAVVGALYCFIQAGQPRSSFDLSGIGWAAMFIFLSVAGFIGIILLAAGQFAALGIFSRINNILYTLIIGGIVSALAVVLVIYGFSITDTSYSRTEEIFNSHKQQFSDTAEVLIERYEPSDEYDILINERDLDSFDEHAAQQLSTLFTDCTKFISIDSHQPDIEMVFYFYRISDRYWGVAYCNEKSEYAEYPLGDNWYAFR